MSARPDRETWKYCVPVVAGTTKEAVEKMKSLAPIADLLELRLDVMDEFSLEELIPARPAPVMATYRSEEEGGGGALSHEAVSDCLCRALDLGADYVDVEYGLPAETRKRLIRMDPSRVVLSRHLTRETPSCEDLTALLDRMQPEGAGVVKIVTLARRWEDNLEVLRLQTVAAERGIASAAFAMGLQGRPSRILSPLLGGVFAFASAAGGAESAPGQLTVPEMRRIMEVLLGDD